MKCPLKNKDCKLSRIFKTDKDNFICSGINKIPTYYEKDTVWICGVGELSKFNLEMTLKEARNFVECLQSSITKKTLEIFSTEKVYCKTCKKKVPRKSTMNGECPQCQNEWIAKDNKKFEKFATNWNDLKNHYEGL